MAELEIDATCGPPAPRELSGFGCEFDGRLTPARGSACRVCIAGDEHGRTQRGNNNAYCQDNEISRVDWSLADGDGDLTELVAALCR
jgi:hypothetical protein